MSILYLDTETYSATPITNGTHAYAEDAEVMLLAYAFGDLEVRVLDLTSSDDVSGALETLKAYVRAPDTTIVMHNAAFDQAVIKHSLGIEIPAERIHDTMAQAYAHALPGALGDLCEVFKIDQGDAKDKRGKDLIQLFCKPTAEGRRNTRETHPAKWAEFIEYAKSDIRAMRKLYSLLPQWNLSHFEHEVWCLDNRINTRGYAVDISLARAAVDAVEIEQQKLARRTQDLTSDAVGSATQRDALLEHLLAQYGVDLPDLTGSTIERRLMDPELPEGVKELLRIRLQAATASNAKYKSLLKAVSKDGRLRGTLQYGGASRTLRWAGRVFQPQNLPRPDMKSVDIEVAIKAFKLGIANSLYDNVNKVASNCIRGCLIASKGKKLVVSDLANIEGRMAAWITGEEWKMRAFEEYDTIIGTDAKGKPVRQGPDLYKLAYARAFNVPHFEVTDDQRQVGKVMELMLQYQGGVGAFITGANAYGIDLEAMADAALPNISADVKLEAEKFWVMVRDDKQRNHGLSQKAFVACDALKRLWRRNHRCIEIMWSDLEAAFRMTLGSDKDFYACGLRVWKSGSWIMIQLPSGRSICYPGAAINNDDKITYLGVNQYNRKWSRISTYGGKLFENIVQAIARDVLAVGALNAERAGYQVVLTVHDELITEAPDTADYSVAGLGSLMTSMPAWAEGLPLAAAGFEGYRYRKG